MRLTRRRVVRGSVAGGLALAGCLGGAGGQSGDGAPTTAPGDTPDSATTGETTTTTGGPTTTAGSVATTIAMVDTAFDPVRASVDAGSTVEWVNRDPFDHDVTAARFHDAAADWRFSETLPGGESTTYTFGEPGVYEYYCSIHGEGTMCGAVLVGGGSLDASLPCEGDSGGGGDDGGDGGGYY